MVRIRTIRMKRLLIFFLIAACLLFLFYHTILLSNKVNFQVSSFFIKQQAILNGIKSSPLMEVDFLKSHINRTLHIVQVTNRKNGEEQGLSLDMRMAAGFLAGFDIGNPRTILGSQMSMLKQYDTRIVSALGAVNESNASQLNEDRDNQHGSSNSTDIVPPENTASQAIPTPTPAGEPEKAVSEVTINPTEPKGYEAVKGIYVKNQSGKAVNIEELFKEKLNIKMGGKGPQVLIVHTHTSEAFTPTAKYFYQPSDPDRSENQQFNIVRVGAEIANNLQSMGIEVLQDKTVHDFPSYNGSYRNSLATIQANLKKYPSIKIVLDVHRDGLTFPNGSKLKVSTTVENTKVAQVMLVVGTDAAGLQHPNWKENLKLALKWQAKMNALYPKLARPIDLRDGRFNQHASIGTLLLEVGSNGNTLEESIASGKYIAKSLAEVIKEIK